MELPLPHELQMVKQRVCLVVIDGWGLPSECAEYLRDGDAIAAAQTPVMDSLMANTAQWTILAAHGLAVGLPDGLMGNSEVGHMNIGAGRIVQQDIVRVDAALGSGVAFDGPAWTSLSASRVHIVALVSDGGVHSHERHVRALVERLAAVEKKEVWIHAITDGRDTAPESATVFLKRLWDVCIANNARVATICGRFYAMDRDSRWERTGAALAAMCGSVQSAAESDATARSETAPITAPLSIEDVLQYVHTKYATGERDEFLKPLIVDSCGFIRSGDAVVLANFRSDRMRQLAAALAGRTSLAAPNNLQIATMTRYSDDLPLPVLVPPQCLAYGLAEVLATAGVAQLRVAETEKYAHVTFFFAGGREEPFDGERRILVPSPRHVATYDAAPAMSVAEVAAATAAGVADQSVGLVVVNLAPPDMVGHTGNYAAAIQAVEATDAAIGVIHSACQLSGAALVVTADHGNAEIMTARLDTGAMRSHTAHTCQPVPLIVAGTDRGVVRQAGSALCDVAPTILNIMGIPAPPEMTGRSLLSG